MLNCPRNRKSPLNIKKSYEEVIQRNLIISFYYENLHELPIIRKLSLSSGINNLKFKKEEAIKVILNISYLTERRPLLRWAKKSNAEMDVRVGTFSGSLLHLEKDNFYAFMDRLLGMGIKKAHKDLHPCLRSDKFGASIGVSARLTSPNIFPEITKELRIFDSGEPIYLSFGVGTKVKICPNESELSHIFTYLNTPLSYPKNNGPIEKLPSLNPLVEIIKEGELKGKNNFKTNVIRQKPVNAQVAEEDLSYDFSGFFFNSI